MKIRVKHALTFVDQYQVLQAIMRTPVLDVYQRMVMMMIYDRSLAWGWKAEQITLEQFEHGVYSPDGECWHPGTGISKRSIQKALAELRELGLVLRSKSGASLKSPCLYLIDTVKLMALPKRLTALTQKPVTSGSWEADEGFTEALGATEPFDTSLGSPAPRLGSPEPRVRFPMVTKEYKGESIKYNSTKEELAERESGLTEVEAITYPKEKPIALIKRITNTWESNYKEYFPLVKAPMLTGIQLNILKSISKTFRSEDDFLDYFGWTIRYWSFLRTTALGWMSNCPEHPCLRCITGAKVRPPLVEAWLKKAESEQIASLPAQEKEILTVQRSKGLSRASAEAEVARKDSVVRERKRLEEERQKLRIREETFNTRSIAIQSALAAPANRRSLFEYSKPVDLSDITTDIPAWEDAQ